MEVGREVVAPGKDDALGCAMEMLPGGGQLMCGTVYKLGKQ